VSRFSTRHKDTTLQELLAERGAFLRRLRLFSHEMLRGLSVLSFAGPFALLKARSTPLLLEGSAPRAIGDELSTSRRARFSFFGGNSSPLDILRDRGMPRHFVINSFSIQQYYVSNFSEPASRTGLVDRSFRQEAFLIRRGTFVPSPIRYPQPNVNSQQSLSPRLSGRNYPTSSFSLSLKEAVERRSAHATVDYMKWRRVEQTLPR